MKIFSLLLAASLVLMPVQQSYHTKGYIFIGDSRIVGMEQALSEREKENIKFIAEVGVGIKLLQTVENQIQEIIKENEEMQWIIICNLGVNDLDNAEKYAKIYQEMSEKYADFHVVSVNPVIENNTHYATNDKIKTFNDLIQQQDFSYIDTNSQIINDFQSIDGLHYSKETYKKIFQIIMEQIKEKEKETEYDKRRIL